MSATDATQAGNEAILAFHTRLPELSPSDFRLSALPAWVPGPLKLAISGYFNQGRNTDDSQPEMSDDMRMHEQEIAMAAFQAGRELRTDHATAVLQKVAGSSQSPHPKEIKVIDPDCFDGKKDQFQPWTVQLAALFAGSRLTYHDDQTKMLAAFGKLRGHALRWASNHMDKSTGRIMYETYADFILALGNAFDDPNWRVHASRRLLTMQQAGSCAEHYAEFQSLYCRLMLTHSPLILEIFTMGLSNPLQDAMAASMSQRPTGSLDEYANWCIKLDEQLAMRQIIRHSTKRQDYGQKSLHSRSTKPPFAIVPTMHSHESTGDAMQLDAANLPYKHKKSGGVNYGHCWKCGQRGHNALKCREDISTPPKIRSLTASAVDPSVDDDMIDSDSGETSKN